MFDIMDVNWGLDYTTLSVYERNLPHWRQEGAVYFVTFRQTDSIPRCVLDGWMEDRKVWLAAYGITEKMDRATQSKHYLNIPDGPRQAFERDQMRRFFVELDKCHGSCRLRHPAVSKIVANSLRFHHGVRLFCGDFIVMPNHVHWLLIPYKDIKLENILHSIKGWSASQINKFLGLKGRFWLKESFDRIVRSAERCERTRDYIRENPLKARLRPGEFCYYEAKWE